MKSAIPISIKIGCCIWIYTGGIIGFFAIIVALAFFMEPLAGTGNVVLATALGLVGWAYIYIGQSILGARVKDTLGYGIISIIVVLLVLYKVNEPYGVLKVLRNSLIIFPLFSGGLLMLIGRKQYKIHKEYLEKIDL